MVITDYVKSFPTVLHIFRLFRRISDMQLKPSKCVIIPLAGGNITDTAEHTKKTYPFL